MALLAAWLTLTLLTSHVPWMAATSQSSLQLKVGPHHHLREGFLLKVGSRHHVREGSQLKVGPNHHLGEGSLHKMKRAVEPVSREYISNLWSDIENAFRFLEEQPVETPSRERAMLDDLQRNRKNEKINRLPFTQHNFIRFGKRSGTIQDTQGLSPESGFGKSGIASSRSLQDVLTRGLSGGFDLHDSQLLESNHGNFFTNPEQSSLTDMDSTSEINEKRELHNFVRFGKRSLQDDNPKKRGLHNFVRFGKRYLQDNIAEKRELHNFVRFGKRFFQDDNPEKRELHNFVRFGKRFFQDDNPEKRELHNFVRFGKRYLQDNNAEKRELHNFVRIGKRYIQNDNPEKREHHNFVRFGRTFSPVPKAVAVESTNSKSSMDW